MSYAVGNGGTQISPKQGLGLLSAPWIPQLPVIPPLSCEGGACRQPSSYLDTCSWAQIPPVRGCAYVCVCVYIYIYIYTHIHTRVHIYIDIIHIHTLYIIYTLYIICDILIIYHILHIMIM